MDWAARELEQARREAEVEMMEKEINRVCYMRSELDPVEWLIRGKPLLRMPRTEAERSIRAQWGEGLQYKLKTKEEVLAFVNRHRIQYELIADPEEDARLDAEAHKRMKAGALLRRKRMALAQRGAGRGYGWAL